MRVNIFMTLIFLGTGLMNPPCYSGIFQSKPVPGVQIEDNRRQPARAAAAAAPPPALPVHQDQPPVVVAAPPVVLVHDPLPGVVPVAPAAPNMQILAATLQAALPPGHTGPVTIHVHMAPPPSGPALTPAPSDVGPSTTLVPPAQERTLSLEAPKPAVPPAQPALEREEKRSLVSTPAAAASSVDQPLDSIRSDSPRSLMLPAAAASSADQSPEDSRFQIVVRHQNVALMLPKSLVLRDQGRYQLALVPKICALYLYDSLSKADHPQFLELNRKDPLADANAVSTAVKWVNHCLEHYGKAYGQFESASQLIEALERTIGSADLSTTKIKFGLDKANKKLIFSMEVTGGYVVFGKIPGHE